MKVMLIMGLGASSANTFIQPLASIEDVDSVLVVRDVPVKTLPRVTYYCPPGWARKLPITKSLLKAAMVFYIAATRKCDVIIANYLYPHGLIGMLAARIFRKPLCVSLVSGQNSTRHWGNFAEKRFIKMLNRAEVVTVTGSATREIYKQKGLDPGKVFCLPNVIDAERFYPLKITKKYDVVYIGRLSREKRLDVLLGAIAIVKQDYPDIRVGIAGIGQSSRSLEELSVKLGIKNNVEFVGFVEDGNHFLNSGKIFVLPSKGEGFPLALLEAMSAGLACIVAKVGDVDDVAIDEQNCLVIDQNQGAESYAVAIKRLLGGKVLYNRLSANAVKVKQSYSLEQSKVRWEKILEAITTKK